MCHVQHKAFQQEIKFQSQAFVGILRAVKLEDVEGKSGENASLKYKKSNRTTCLTSFGKYVRSLRQSFLKIYQRVLLPNGWGMNSKLISNKILPQSIGLSTSSTCLICRKQQLRSIQFSSMDLYDALNPMGCPHIILYQRRTTTFDSILIIVG